MKIKDYGFCVSVEVAEDITAEYDLNTTIMSLRPTTGSLRYNNRKFIILHNGKKFGVGSISQTSFSIFINDIKVCLDGDQITFKQAISKAILQLKFKRNKLVDEVDSVDSIIDTYEKYYGEVLVDNTL